MKRYNKLVRDKIPEIIEKKGGKAIVHRANSKEYWEKLKEKLLEEVKEFFKSESIEEFADILEVNDAIRIFKKFGGRKILAVKRKKLKERGGFKKRIILEES